MESLYKEDKINAHLNEFDPNICNTCEHQDYCRFREDIFIVDDWASMLYDPSFTLEEGLNFLEQECPQGIEICKSGTLKFVDLKYEAIYNFLFPKGIPSNTMLIFQR